MSYDVLLTVDRDLPINRYTLRTGIEIIAQRVATRLKIAIGTWILDRNAGLDFIGYRTQKPPDVDVIGLDIRREIETTPGVIRVANFEGAFTPSTRTLRYTGDVIVEGEDGDEVIGITVDPFSAEGNTSPGVFFMFPAGFIVRGF